MGLFFSLIFFWVFVLLLLSLFCLFLFVCLRNEEEKREGERITFSSLPKECYQLRSSFYFCIYLLGCFFSFSLTEGPSDPGKGVRTYTEKPHLNLKLEGYKLHTSESAYPSDINSTRQLGTRGCSALIMIFFSPKASTPDPGKPDAGQQGLGLQIYLQGQNVLDILSGWKLSGLSLPFPSGGFATPSLLETCCPLLVRPKRPGLQGARASLPRNLVLCC